MDSIDRLVSLVQSENGDPNDADEDNVQLSKITTVLKYLDTVIEDLPSKSLLLPETFKVYQTGVLLELFEKLCPSMWKPKAHL